MIQTDDGIEMLTGRLTRYRPRTSRAAAEVRATGWPPRPRPESATGIRVRRVTYVFASARVEASWRPWGPRQRRPRDACGVVTPVAAAGRLPSSYRSWFEPHHERVAVCLLTDSNLAPTKRQSTPPILMTVRTNTSPSRFCERP